jgi:hypothetical protein
MAYFLVNQQRKIQIDIVKERGLLVWDRSGTSPRQQLPLMHMYFSLLIFFVKPEFCLRI